MNQSFLFFYPQNMLLSSARLWYLGLQQISAYCISEQDVFCFASSSSAQFMCVDEHWWQRQQIVGESSFLCQPSHLWWAGNLAQQSLREIKWYTMSPVHQRTHTIHYTHTQGQFRVSNHWVLGPWEKSEKIKNIQKGSKTVVESMRQSGWFNNSMW